MNKLKSYKSFTKLDSDTPTLVKSTLLQHINYNCCKVSVYQARLEAREYFDKIREWNLNQVKTNPEPLVMEMAVL